MAIRRSERTALAQQYRWAILGAYRNLCQYCENIAHCIDHVEPLAKGGEDVLENMVPACVRCNQKKADLSLLCGYKDILISRAINKVKLIKRIHEKMESGLPVKGEDRQ